MVNGDAPRERQQTTQPLRWRDVGCGAGAEESPDKRKKPQLLGGPPAFSRIAAQAFQVVSGPEVSGTWCAAGLNEKLSVGTNCLKTMMFD